ncbi:MAG: tape measure protein [Pirellula sp.]
MAKNDVEAGRAHVLLSIRDKLQQGLRVAEKRLRQFGTVMATSGGVMAAGMGAALAWPIKLAANMEQTKTSFAVFLGDADLANRKLHEIEQLAASTPFTFDELKDGAKTLLNFGVSAEALMPTLKNLGDVSGGEAERFQRLSLAFGQTMAKGRLMGQEVNQMVEAGFNPLQEISRTTGRSMKDLTDSMEKGQISSRMLAQAFATASGPGGRFHGMMEKQSQTLIGLFSTLMDNAAIMARTLGDALLPVLKTFTKIGITISKVVTGLVEKYQGIVRIVGIVALVVGGLGAVFVGVGVAIMAASFVIGIIGAVIAKVVAVLAVVFSKVGVVIALVVLALIGAGVVAYHFRDRIRSAFGSFMTFIRPAIDAFFVMWDIFKQTFNGIVSALTSGNLEAAAAIAWAGFQAMAWTAIDYVSQLIQWLLGYVEMFLPGLTETFQSVFSGIGQAILAGRWDLAAGMMMLKVSLAFTKGWNGIKMMWDMMTTGIGEIWDNVAWGMRTTFRTVVYGIAQSITWIGQRFYDLLGFLEPIFEYIGQKDLFNNVRESFNAQGMGNVLSEMQAQAQAEDDKALTQSMMRRDKANFANMQKRADEEKRYANEIAAMQQMIDEETADSEIKTIGDKAKQAQAALADALAKADQDQKDKYKTGEKLGAGPQSLLAGAASTGGGKSGSTGTFSALGSMLAGTTRNRAADQTAANTKRLVKLAEDEAKKKQVADAMKE